MDWVTLFTLSVVQGITEFLPISSDGHLAVIGAMTQMLTGTPLKDPLSLTILLHAGTLASIVLVFRKKLFQLIASDRQVLPRIIVATIPAVLVGIPAKKFANHLLSDPLLAGCMLPLTGLMLVWAARAKEGEGDYQKITYQQALIIGACQAVAILPGISRSGMTICSALMLGLKRESAATFSFLLAVPVIGGAVLLDLKDLVAQGGSADFSAVALLVATVVTFVVGVAALKWLLSWVRHGKLHYFAWWCIPFGLGIVVWQIWLRFAS